MATIVLFQPGIGTVSIFANYAVVKPRMPVGPPTEMLQGKRCLWEQHQYHAATVVSFRCVLTEVPDLFSFSLINNSKEGLWGIRVPKVLPQRRADLFIGLREAASL